MVNVQWTEPDKALLAQADNWRAKQRLEKILYHNRDALDNHKHVITPTPVGQPVSCSVCFRTNSNLCKFLMDSCGGAFDQANAVPGERKANEHNLKTNHGHWLCVPTTLDELPSCSVCGAQQTWEGWKRVQKFLRQTCPFAK